MNFPASSFRNCWMEFLLPLPFVYFWLKKLTNMEITYGIFNLFQRNIFLNGSWSLLWTNPFRLCLGNMLTQMSCPWVCQYAKTETITGIKRGMWFSTLLSGRHDISEGICDCREDQAVIFAGFIFCCVRTKLSSVKVKRIIEGGRHNPRTDCKVGFSFTCYFPQRFILLF